MEGGLVDWNYKSQSDSSSVFHSKKCGGNMRGPQESPGGTAVAKRKSYEGGGSKGKEGTGGNALKLGCRWVLGFGNGV